MMPSGSALRREMGRCSSPICVNLAARANFWRNAFALATRSLDLEDPHTLNRPEVTASSRRQSAPTCVLYRQFLFEQRDLRVGPTEFDLKIVSFRDDSTSGNGQGRRGERNGMRKAGLDVLRQASWYRNQASGTRGWTPWDSVETARSRHHPTRIITERVKCSAASRFSEMALRLTRNPATLSSKTCIQLRAPAG